MQVQDIEYKDLGFMQALPEFFATKLIELHDPEATKRFSFFRQPLTEEREVAYLEHMKRSETDALWTVASREGNDAVLLGTAGLHEIDRNLLTARLGVIIWNTRFHRRGYGTMILEALISQAFDSLGLEKVYVRCQIDNTQAQALYQRIGFVPEGVLRREYRLGDQRLDMVQMGLLKEDWQAKKEGRSEPS